MVEKALGKTGAPMTVFSMRAFTRHFFGMVFPMMLGCGVTCYVGLTVLALPLNIYSVGTLFALLVTVNMTVPMALSMRYSMHHSWKSTGEMSGAMFLPLVFLVPYWAGLIVPGLLLCPLICVSMFPLMLAEMLYRRSEYGTMHQMHHMHAAMTGSTHELS